MSTYGRVVEEETSKASPYGRVVEKPSREDLEKLVDQTAAKYKVDPLAVRAIIARESSWDPDATGVEVEGQGRAGGLMQLMPDTARRLGVKNVYDPAENIDAGVRLLAQNFSMAGHNFPKALKFYHGGTNEKNWGEKTNAYADNVLATYRGLGGRLYDPEVGEATLPQVALNAALPGGAATQAWVRATQGRGPDLSQGLSGPDANLPVGQKFMNWLRAKGPADAELERLDKAIANRKDEDPWTTTGVELAASLPAGVALGTGANSLIAGAAPVVGRAVSSTLPKLGQLGGWMGSKLPSAEGVSNFLLGRGGYGVKGTGEGASFGGRVASGAAQGAIQGAAGAGVAAHLSDAPIMDQLETGAMLGGGLGGLGRGVAEGFGRAFFGPRMHPESAKLGQDVRAGQGVPQMDLSPGPFGGNPLVVDTPQFTRKVATQFGENVAPRVPEDWRKVEAKIGERIERGGENSHVPLDREFIEGLHDLGAEFGDTVLGSPRYKKVQQELNTIFNAYQDTGVWPGKDVLAFTKTGKPGSAASPIATMIASPDADVSRAGVALKNYIMENLERGAQERLRIATANGDVKGVEAATNALRDVAEGRQQWKALKTAEEVAAHTTGEIQPGDLARAVEKHFRGKLATLEGEMPKLARAGQTFDPNLETPAWKKRLLPWLSPAASAALFTAASQTPWTTGQAGLALAGTAVGGHGVLQALKAYPGVPGAMLRRSAEQGPGHFQRGLAATTVPMMGAGGNLLFASPPER